MARMSSQHGDALQRRAGRLLAGVTSFRQPAMPDTLVPLEATEHSARRAVFGLPAPEGST
jgi:hypothetical protein